MKIKKYIKPELIDLNYSSVRANCVGGSSDAAECEDGGHAFANCYGHGTLAGSNCYTHGTTAVAWCYTEGNLPGIACIVGAIHIP